VASNQKVAENKMFLEAMTFKNTEIQKKLFVPLLTYMFWGALEHRGSKNYQEQKVL